VSAVSFCDWTGGLPREAHQEPRRSRRGGYFFLPLPVGLALPLSAGLRAGLPALASPA
jgi:hypothetical protein